MENAPKSSSKIFKIIGYAILPVVLIAAWYLAIPAIIIWYLYKKNKKFSAKTKLITSTIVSIVFILLGAMSMYGGKAPVITISEPANNFSIQANRVLVKGNVNPSDSKLTINYLPIEVDKNGYFAREIPLKNGDNVLNIVAENGDKMVSTNISVKRIFTLDEIAQKEEEERLAKEAEARVKAEAEAELQAYYATPAGIICKSHPEWSEKECEALADRKIWIGMTYDMLVYLRGKPNSINPSNYGRGTQYQYCWHDYKPSCFYDRNEDDIMDAYN